MKTPRMKTNLSPYAKKHGWNLCRRARHCIKLCLVKAGHGGIRNTARPDAREMLIPESFRVSFEGNTAPKVVLVSGGNQKLEKTGSVGISLLPSDRFRQLLANRAFFNGVERARFYRTALFFFHQDVFRAQVAREISRYPLKTTVRLNVMQDVLWEEAPELYSFPQDRQHYDYTKHTNREVPKNYALAYSLHDGSTAKDLTYAARLGRMAIVADTVENARAIVEAGSVKDINGVVWKTIDANPTDAWIYASYEAEHVVGVLTPKGKLRREPNEFSRAWKKFLTLTV